MSQLSPVETVSSALSAESCALPTNHSSEALNKSQATPVPPSRNTTARQLWAALLALPQPEARRKAANWDWYALLRLVQAAFQESPRIGYSLHADQEALRLGQPTFFHHPATTIADFALHGPRQKPAGGLPTSQEAPVAGPVFGTANGRLPTAWLYSYHFGFFGPYGPLPLHLTEFASRNQRAQDHAFFAFCNVLIHRLSCFFFRAWAEGRKELTFDRPRALDAAHHACARLDIARHGEECWEFYFGALVGCGLDSIRSRDNVPEDARLFYAGRLMQPTRNAEGLRAIVQDYFAAPARLLEFQPRTLPIPESARWYLGADSPTGNLSWSTLVGASIVEHQSGFRLRLGPLSLTEIEQFFPDPEGRESDAFRQLHDWIRFYCGKETDPNPQAGIESAWDLQLVLRGPEVPELHPDPSARLGLTTWLCSTPPLQDVDDLVLRPSGRAEAQSASPDRSQVGAEAEMVSGSAEARAT
jgi:type VI secretion system protein ImpH